MTQDAGPINADLVAYSSANEATRKLIETQLDRVHWQARQQYFLQWAGLVLGFLVTIAFLGGAIYLISNGHDTAGTVLGTVDIVALVAVFVVGRRIDPV